LLVVTASQFNVLITGSTKGVGKALATEFIRAGDSVVITSRDPTRVSNTVDQLTSLIPSSSSSSQKIVGLPGDVSNAKDVKALGQFALDQLGSIDIWINNAGSNAYAFKPLIEQTPEEIQSITDTNILGSLLCCRQAITLMSQQPGRGHIFLMDGAGADGGPTPRFAAYGATKRSLQQLSKSLSAELRSAKLQDKIAVHNLSPGMVVTDLLMAGADTKVSRWFINRLAERPETVAKNLVPRVRQVVGEASPLPIAGIPSAYVRFLTKPAAYSKILKGLIGVGKNRFVNEDDI
jgi:chlorophyll(ide) b reductase